MPTGRSPYDTRQMTAQERLVNDLLRQFPNSPRLREALQGDTAPNPPDSPAPMRPYIAQPGFADPAIAAAQARRASSARLMAISAGGGGGMGVEQPYTPTQVAGPNQADARIAAAQTSHGSDFATKHRPYQVPAMGNPPSIIDTLTRMRQPTAEQKITAAENAPDPRTPTGRPVPDWVVRASQPDVGEAVPGQGLPQGPVRGRLQRPVTMNMDIRNRQPAKPRAGVGDAIGRWIKNAVPQSLRELPPTPVGPLGKPDPHFGVLQTDSVSGGGTGALQGPPAVRMSLGPRGAEGATLPIEGGALAPTTTPPSPAAAPATTIPPKPVPRPGTSAIDALKMARDATAEDEEKDRGFFNLTKSQRDGLLEFGLRMMEAAGRPGATAAGAAGTAGRTMIDKKTKVDLAQSKLALEKRRTVVAENALKAKRESDRLSRGIRLHIANLQRSGKGDADLINAYDKAIKDGTQTITDPLTLAETEVFSYSAAKAAYKVMAPKGSPKFPTKAELLGLKGQHKTGEVAIVQRDREIDGIPFKKGDRIQLQADGSWRKI